MRLALAGSVPRRDGRRGHEVSILDRSARPMLGLRENLGAVLAARPDQRLRRRDGRHGAVDPAAPRRAQVRHRVAERDALVPDHVRLRSRRWPTWPRVAQPDRWGRRRTLLAGWIAGIPVPLLIIFAPSWGAGSSPPTSCSGINQGLCWSTAIIMKVDLVGGARRRGLAIGPNESSGYLAAAAAALATGCLAARLTPLRPAPFLPRPRRGGPRASLGSKLRARDPRARGAGVPQAGRAPGVAERRRRVPAGGLKPTDRFAP